MRFFGAFNGITIRAYIPISLPLEFVSRPEINPVNPYSSKVDPEIEFEHSILPDLILSDWVLMFGVGSARDRDELSAKAPPAIMDKMIAYFT